MHYNTRVIYYQNGSIQVRRYKRPLGDDSASTVRRDDSEINPFDLKKTKVVDEFLTDEEQKIIDDDNRRRSYSRTKQKVYDYTRSNIWEWFATFTFDPKKVDSTDFSLVSKKIRIWLNNQRSKNPDMKYIVVPELHSDGRKYHFHALLSGIDSIKKVYSGHDDSQGRAIYNLSGWRNGFSTITRITDFNRASSYLVKYITKDMFVLEKGKQKYFVSNNLELPNVVLYLINDVDFDDMIDELCENYSKKVGFTKTVNPDTEFETTYIELNDDNCILS